MTRLWFKKSRARARFAFREVVHGLAPRILGRQVLAGDELVGGLSSHTLVASGHDPLPWHVWRLDAGLDHLVVHRGGAVQVGRRLLDVDFGAGRSVYGSARGATRAGTVFAPWAHDWCTYYDFLFYVAARVSRLRSLLPDEEWRQISVAYPLRGTAFEDEVLGLLDVPPERRFDTRSRALAPRHVYVADLPSWFDLPERDLASLRRYLLPAGGAAAPAHGRRLYVQRSGTRRVNNEAEVVQRLRSHGFELLEDRRRSVAEQIAIFAEAEMIVGPHGAGLANMAWMSPGATVVELLPEQFAPPFYERLAARLGLVYLAVGGTGKSGTMNGDPMRLFIDPVIHASGGEDFRVDGAALQAALDRHEARSDRRGAAGG
jgi:hypothetical protein